jgi:Leucine-rich repeat (LRR) protein
MEMKRIACLFLSFLLFISLLATGYAQEKNTLDNTPPQVSIIAPLDGQTVYEVSGQVIILAEATDNVGVSKVEFYIDGIKMGEATTSPYTYIWDTYTLPCNSKHTIQAKAYDKAGNVGESSIITVTIGDPVIKFFDSSLERILRVVLGTPITKEKMKRLQSLIAERESISNLSGLEYAINLQELRLRENFITDITPLAKLINLQVLYLDNNRISDISPLAKLTNLQKLILSANQITDISPLANLTNLQELWLNYNKISDISPLAKLTNLKVLYLNNNNISDISPLVRNTGLGEGDEIHLAGNPLDLSEGSITVIYIQILQNRGVKVY